MVNYCVSQYHTNGTLDIYHVKTNDFYKCTKILVWFSVSVDFISSGAIVYGVIDDLYQLVIQYFGENKKQYLIVTVSPHVT